MKLHNSGLCDYCGENTFYSASVGVRSIVINPSVHAFVCLRAYLWNRWTNWYVILCADPLWPWLGPLPTSQKNF